MLNTNPLITNDLDFIDNVATGIKVKNRSQKYIFYTNAVLWSLTIAKKKRRDQ